MVCAAAAAAAAAAASVATATATAAHIRFNYVRSPSSFEVLSVYYCAWALGITTGLRKILRHHFLNQFSHRGLKLAASGTALINVRLLAPLFVDRRWVEIISFRAVMIGRGDVSNGEKEQARSSIDREIKGVNSSNLYL